MLKTFFLAIVAGMISAPAMAASLIIDDAWSPLAPPGRMMAGFMTLENQGADAIVLTGAESPRFGRVEIHTMTMDDGVMRMRKLESLEIPAGETVLLAPSGLHLMLMQPKGDFELGERFDITLIGSLDQRWPVSLELRERRSRPQRSD